MRFLLYPVLLLTCICFSSCYTTVHQYFWQRAKVAESAWWVQDSENIELYRVGDAFYAKGYHGRARGCYKGSPFNNVVHPHGMGGFTTFCPIDSTGTPVYFRVEDYSRDNILEAMTAGKPSAIISLQNAGEANLTQLPPTAQLIPVRGKHTGSITTTPGSFNNDGKDVYTTDDHKYYAYPLGALTAVVVDAPLTTACNAAVLGGAVAALPASLIYPLVKHQQQTPEPEPATQNP